MPYGDATVHENIREKKLISSLFKYSKLYITECSTGQGYIDSKLIYYENLNVCVWQIVKNNMDLSGKDSQWGYKYI